MRLEIDQIVALPAPALVAAAAGVLAFVGWMRPAVVVALLALALAAAGSAAGAPTLTAAVRMAAEGMADRLYSQIYPILERLP